MPWTLVILDGERSRRAPLLVAETLVGSDAAADLRLDHPTVSRRHARLLPGEDGVRVEDLGSSNGTRVDGRTIDGTTVVGEGQMLHFGSAECRLEQVAVAETEAALEFGAESSPETPAIPAGGTLSVGSVRDFVVSALPSLIARLEEKRRADADASPSERNLAALSVVQAAGDALFEAFPCRALEMSDRASAPCVDAAADEAVLFRAGDAALLDQPAAGGDDSAEIAAGRLCTKVLFVPGLHTASVVPLVELVTRLAALELPEIEGFDAEPREVANVELPKPPTVDPQVRQIYEDARRIAAGNVGVLILGESGTGKEVLAKFIHACSARARGGNGSLVALNCAALPQDLLEAELFGIERGVATGVEARAGKFEQADGGTLFLDEIGDMAPATQAKILRVLQEGEVYRLGGQKPRPARVRVIAATNQDLGRMIEAGDFRRDLYHRIADCRFTLPPLRERLADLPNLAGFFLQRAAAEAGVRVRGVSRAALDALVGFSWPGNVRQLEREMARAALFLGDGELLQTRHLHDEVAQVGVAGNGAAASNGTLKSRLEATERAAITETLIRLEGNVRAAATELGVGRTTLYRRMQELGIEAGSVS